VSDRATARNSGRGHRRLTRPDRRRVHGRCRPQRCPSQPLPTRLLPAVAARNPDSRAPGRKRASGGASRPPVSAPVAHGWATKR